ncbi:carbohydrate ABC transporter permease [Microvirga terricola]|uniref:sn-glycerol-3-phosphate transport system permease protein UgpE n=1 Tax=Microvirga terricola TaxID=2719797 RepID=A0ABX0V5F4_9HYPH|nr:carbohydrate ABC transporter permease [Microvirga terricola]NIX75070.1 carbohydrate ABC transporter permease [Microvirga terricola]
MRPNIRPGRIAVHIALVLYTILAIGPIALILINAFKTRRAIFSDPLGFPDARTFTTIGFDQVFTKSDFGLYFVNSLTVTVVSLGLIILIGAMAAWALTEYRFRGNTIIALYMAIGIMVPIRLGSVSILRMMVELNLVNTLTALVLVYVAQGLPLAILILGEFIQQIPRDLRDAARCDGVSEYRIFASIILPLITPAIATVAVFTMVPIWNDLWFPLILAPGDGKQTVTLGVQQFIGQYVTDWNAVLASLTLAIAPILVLYLLFSRYLVRGLTAGAVK